MVTTVDTGAEDDEVEVDTTVVEAPEVDGTVVVVAAPFTVPFAAVVLDVAVVVVVVVVVVVDVEVAPVVAGTNGMASCSGTLHIRVNSR